MKINLCTTFIVHLRHLLSFGTLALLFLFPGTMQVYANPNQSGTITVKGVVIDGITAEPVIGASVLVKGTTNGVITNLDGEFVITTAPNSTLQISFVGYITREVEVNNRTQLNIQLSEDMQSLEEVVVVGYGVQKKKLITGATVQVKGDDIAKLNTVSPIGALQSMAPGVNIVKNSGKPGDGYKVTIRGLGTIGDSSPLYIIDGMIGGDINLLNPSDIESIDILKDAASTAIYGSRAANGVILATTKKGVVGKPVITLDTYVGWQNMYKKPQLLNALEYATIMDEARMNDGLAPYNFAAMVPYWDKIQSGEWKGTNWLDEMTTKDAFQQNYALNISGGTDQSVYSLGLAYTSQEGLLGGGYIDSNYERYSARINSEYILLKNSSHNIITVGENTTFSHVKRTGLDFATGGVYWNDFRGTLGAHPFMPVYDDEGNFHKEMSSWVQGANPIGQMYYNRGNNLDKSYTLRTNFYASVQPIKDLVIRSSFAVNYSGNSYRRYVPVYDLGGIAVVKPGMDTTEQRTSSGLSWIFDNTASYNFSLYDTHNIGLLIGMSAEKWGMGENLSGSNVGSEFDDFKHAYLNNNKIIYADKTSLSGSPWGPGSIASYFGRVNYDYKGTYMATFNMRADGSSKFARGNRWGYFPSVSAGWIVTNEPFMESTRSWMDFFKLRASWGKNGNMNIDSFQYLASINIGGANYFFGDNKLEKEVGSFPSILANPDITWEKSSQFDIGFDATFLNNRLGVNFDFYNKETKDWLVRAPILASYGTGAPYINGGDVRNRGFELALNWNDNIGDFRYGANINMSYNKNKVLRIANSEGIINGPGDVLSGQSAEMYRAQVGYPIGYFYGYKTDGIFQNEAEIKAYTGKNGMIMPDAKPGDVKFVDRNGNGTIDADDRTMIGNPHPDYTMGLSLNASWKGFDISITGNGTFGNEIAQSYRDYAMSALENYTMDIVKDRWHGEGSSNKYPRLTSTPHINWTYVSDIYIQKGDYFRISNLTLGYDFTKLFKSLPFQQIRLYGTVQNLYTFTNYNGFDPEVGYGGGNNWSSGIDLGYYPGARTFIIGANIKF